jgi:hypothetical protein
MEFNKSIMDEDDQMVKGMCFKDVKEFRKALESSHIKQGRSYNFVKNKMEKVKVRCSDSSCPFSLFCIVNNWRINLHDKARCAGTYLWHN